MTDDDKSDVVEFVFYGINNFLNIILIAVFDPQRDYYRDDNENKPFGIVEVICIMLISIRYDWRLEKVFYHEHAIGGELVELPCLEQYRGLLQFFLRSKLFYTMIVIFVAVYIDINVYPFPERYERVVFAELPHLLMLIYVIVNFFRWRQLDGRIREKTAVSLRGIA